MKRSQDGVEVGQTMGVIFSSMFKDAAANFRGNGNCDPTFASSLATSSGQERPI